MQIDTKGIIASLTLTALVLFGSFLLMKHLAHKQIFHILLTNWRNYFHNIFYVLNEDIVLGALILYGMITRKKMHPIVASMLLAAMFSLVHYVFYRWVFTDRGTLSVITLALLFLIGLLRNNLIVQTGHIGYSWALHVGWMAVMFGCNHIFPDSNIRVTEPERLNIYIGSAEVFVIALILALASTLYLFKSKIIRTNE